MLCYTGTGCGSRMWVAAGGAIGGGTAMASMSSHSTWRGLVVFTFPSRLAAWPAEGVYLVTFDFPIATGQARSDRPRFRRYR